MADSRKDTKTHEECMKAIRSGRPLDELFEEARQNRDAPPPPKHIQDTLMGDVTYLPDPPEEKQPEPEEKEDEQFPPTPPMMGLVVPTIGNLFRKKKKPRK